MSRFTYHSLVIVWLVILAAIDFGANTMMTGLWSKIYLWKVFFEVAVIAWTWMYLQEDLNGSVVHETHYANTPGARADEQVVTLNLGAWEYAYYGFLVLYGAGNLYLHFQINSESTGILSMATAVLCLVDGIVLAVAGINIAKVAQGKYVRLQQRAKA